MGVVQTTDAPPAAVTSEPASSEPAHARPAPYGNGDGNAAISDLQEQSCGFALRGFRAVAMAAAHRDREIVEAIDSVRHSA
jgi:hypothetical protein